MNGDFGSCGTQSYRANTQYRTKIVLDDVFANDSNTYVSVSSHSGEIGSILRGTFFPLFLPSSHSMLHSVFSSGTEQRLISCSTEPPHMGSHHGPNHPGFGQAGYRARNTAGHDYRAMGIHSNMYGASSSAHSGVVNPGRYG